jgi:4-amino-4-deoxy-L-arabinose transferase-like glycosyltransferase
MMTNEKQVSMLMIGLLIFMNFTGLNITILEPDGALYAGIAKHMAQHHDYLNLFADGRDWLDKPHFPFWIAALSFQALGFTTAAYKLPAILFILMGAGYTFLLARRLYNEQTARWAVCILLSAEHLVISNNDVRAEPYLTGLIIGAVYHFYRSQRSFFNYDLALGALFTACAVMTKGPFALIPVGGAIAGQLVFTGQWKQLLHLRWWLGLVMIALFITPELYALYQQFDLHPEKVVFGSKGVSGIRFFFWDSQFGRFMNTGPIKGAGDPFFFFHTVLWAFLPWSVLLYAAVVVFFKKKKVFVAGSSDALGSSVEPGIMGGAGPSGGRSAQTHAGKPVGPDGAGSSGDQNASAGEPASQAGRGRQDEQESSAAGGVQGPAGETIFSGGQAGRSSSGKPASQVVQGTRAGQGSQAASGLQTSREYYCISAALLTFALFSLSRFQLPHYLNIIFPFFSILTAQYVLSLGRLKFYRITQYIIIGIVGAAIIGLAVLYRPQPNYYALFCMLLGVVLFLLLPRWLEGRALVFYRTCAAALVLNLFLNLLMYPDMMRYQSGSSAARFANQQLPGMPIGMLGTNSYALEFYLNAPVQRYDSAGLRRAAVSLPVVLFTNPEEMAELQKKGYSCRVVREFPHFYVSRLELGFVNHATREAALQRRLLVMVQSGKAAWAGRF